MIGGTDEETSVRDCAAAPAYADIVVIGVSTPDSEGSGTVTTNSYSNYTGPIELTIQAAAQSRSIAPILTTPRVPQPPTPLCR